MTPANQSIARLDSLETGSAIRLTDSKWTPQNGLSNILLQTLH